MSDDWTLLAADNLAGRINLAGGFIRAWNDADDGSKAGWAIYGDYFFMEAMLKLTGEELFIW